MVFTLLLSVDAFPAKPATEVFFPSRPQIQVLTNEVTRLLRKLGRSLVRLQLQGESGWEEVASPSQLTDYGKLLAVTADVQSTGSASKPSTTTTQYVAPPNPFDLLPRRSPQTEGKASSPSPSLVGNMVLSQTANSTGEVAEDEKALAVFNEFDTTRNRTLNLECFTAMFSLVPELAPKAPELFRKADLNGDDVISWAEFQRFSENYPTLLDSLFYRMKDTKLDHRQKEQIAATSKSLQEQRRVAEAAAKAHQAAQAETMQQDRRLQHQTAVVAESHQREQAAKADLDNAAANTIQARSALQEAIGMLERKKGETMARQGAIGTTAMAVQQCERKLASQLADHSKVAERLAEIQRMLDEQQRVVLQHEQEVRKVRAELEEAQSKHSFACETHAAAEREEAAAVSTVNNLETEVASRQEQERDAAARHREAVNDTARQVAKRDLAERELKTLHTKEGQRRTEQLEAKRGLDDLDRRLKAMQQENAELAARRKEAEDEERAMLTQELELRSRREDMERAEAELRNKHRRFAARHAGRGEPVRVADSRAPSTASMRHG